MSAPAPRPLKCFRKPIELLAVQWLGHELTPLPYVLPLLDRPQHGLLLLPSGSKEIEAGDWLVTSNGGSVIVVVNHRVFARDYLLAEKPIQDLEAA